MSKLKAFLVPKADRRFFVRLSVLAASMFFLFGVVLQPVRIQGRSMEPTYHDGSFLLGNRLLFRFRKARVGDVVLVRMSGERVMYLKRVVAVAGDIVAFRDGVLHVNGLAREESYVKSDCDWNLEPRRVKPGHVYVVGDNRGTPMETHSFGATPESRLAGGPLWLRYEEGDYCSCFCGSGRVALGLSTAQRRAADRETAPGAGERICNGTG